MLTPLCPSLRSLALPCCHPSTCSRSIGELESPSLKPNHSTDIIRQRTAEKERSCEVNLNDRPGTINHMQFTFSVAQLTSTASAVPVQNPDLRLSAEFMDNVTRRTRRTAATQEDTQADSTNDKDTHHTQYDPKDAEDTVVRTGACFQDAFLRFPTLFSTDFGLPFFLLPPPSRAP